MKRTKEQPWLVGVGGGVLALLAGWGVRWLVRRRRSSPPPLEPELLAAITIAVEAHRQTLRHLPPEPDVRPLQTPVPQEPWVVAGRTRQNVGWHPQQRRSRQGS